VVPDMNSIPSDESDAGFATCSPSGQATSYGPRDQRIIGLDCLIPVTQRVIGRPLLAIDANSPLAWRD